MCQKYVLSRVSFIFIGGVLHRHTVFEHQHFSFITVIFKNLDILAMA
jgi:hypothetical protein